MRSNASEQANERDRRKEEEEWRPRQSRIKVTREPRVWIRPPSLLLSRSCAAFFTMASTSLKRKEISLEDVWPTLQACLNQMLLDHLAPMDPKTYMENYTYVALVCVSVLE